MRVVLSLSLAALAGSTLARAPAAQCTPITPGDMFLDPTTIPESATYPVTVLALPGPVTYANAGDPVIGLKIAPPEMLDPLDDYVADVDYGACIDASLGEGRIDFLFEGVYVVRVDRMSGSQTLEIVKVGAKTLGTCYSEGAIKEFDCPTPPKAFEGDDADDPPDFPNQCTVTSVPDLVMKVCTESTTQGGPIDLILVDHGCEGSISINGQRVSCDPADAANLMALCGLAGKIKSITLLSCSTGHGTAGRDFLRKLSQKFGGIIVTGYTGDVSSWNRNGRRVWGSYGEPVSEKASPTLPFPGDGVNMDFLLASPAVLGQPWMAIVNIGHPHGTGGPMALRVRTNTFIGPVFPSPQGGRLTQFLIGGPFLASIFSTHNGVSGGFPPQAVPQNTLLFCLSWACQATVVGGGFADLSTAFTGVVGTY
jgi:hypothetical protein